MRRLLLRLLVGVVALAAALYGLRALARSRGVQTFGTIVDRVETPERRVALTFDDGPTREITDSILAILGAREVSATFFVTGAEVSAAPEAARRLAAAGHELGNHTWSHERMVLRPLAFYRQELARTDSAIRAAGHAGPIRFRPPYAYKLFGLPWVLRQSGRTTVTWDVEPDSYPEVAATSEGIVRHVLERVRPGSIILLHIWYPSRATSLAAVGPLVDSLRARGYAVGPVRDLLPESPAAAAAGSATTAGGRGR